MELVISELTKEYNGFYAVDHVSTSMGTGVYGLLGVNGAGKTTLMRMLCTLIHPSSGFITLNGKDIFEMDSEYRKILGYLPQEFGFYPDFSVNDYLMYIASIKGIQPTVARKRIRDLLSQTGLNKVEHKKMKKLSGGMKRRVGIAQAMLNDPRILILDEPTAGLDPGERIRFRNLISELSQDRLVLLSTHIVSDIESIADQILLMKDGMIRMSGTEEQLLSAVTARVWRCAVSTEEADRMQQNYLVANRRSVPGGVELQIISEEKPSPAAFPEQLTLEGLFLHIFGKKEGNRHGEI